jgi:Putative MetA-pathway of phenol degradation
VSDFKKSVNGKRPTVNGRGRWWPAYRLPLTAYAVLWVLPSSLSGQIQDNSFLLEEAYNQEAGVVQHISAFARSSSGDWGYSFTQEWPLGGIHHQVSYTLPIEHAGGTGTGLGDIALNYRYQLIGNPEARTVMAPRLSLLLPTGNEEVRRGAGALGVQLNIPLTIVPDSHFVFHANAGATIIPSARSASGAEATTLSRNVGASLVWLLRPSVNVLVEALWVSDESVVSDGSTTREEITILSPGVRAAFDLSGSLQIVPGIAYSIGLSPEGAEDAVFLYLSFEHPFKRQ